MTSLALFERAFNALAEAETVDVVLSLLDEFAMAKTLAQRLRDHEMLSKAMEWELRGERRLGEVIRAAKAAGLFRPGRQVGDEEKGSEPRTFPRPTLEEAGIDKHLSSRAQQRARMEPAEFEEVVTATRERIASGRAKIVESAPSAHTAGRITNAGDLDYSPTPPWATRALMEIIFPHLGIHSLSTAWEPACGEGHMAEPLAEYFHDVIASDIFNYGYAPQTCQIQDFLKYTGTVLSTDVDWVITNPPFEDRVLKFMVKALEIARVGVAMFLQLRYLEGLGRYEKVYRFTPPTLIAPFVERVPLLMGHYDPKASTTTAFMWLVWVKGEQPRAPFWIPPGCREALTKPDDAERFTQHPVPRKTWAAGELKPRLNGVKTPPIIPAKPPLTFWEHV
jgi:hypothetical protein